MTHIRVKCAAPGCRERFSVQQTWQDRQGTGWTERDGRWQYNPPRQYFCNRHQNHRESPDRG